MVDTVKAEHWSVSHQQEREPVAYRRAEATVPLAVSDQVYFNSDSIGIRATFRFGRKSADTSRIVKLTISDSE